MDSLIINRLRQHALEFPSKRALIIDDHIYTYGDLWNALEELNVENHPHMLSLTNDAGLVTLIDVNSVWDQLILWLKALALGYRPIMSHRQMDRSYKEGIQSLLESMSIDESARFAVLTSGTTGMPKPLWRTEVSWVHFFDEQNEVFSISNDTTIFMHGSFSFTGNMNMMLAVLWAGGTIVTSNKMQPKSWILWIDEYQCSHIYLLPTKLRLLLRFYKDSLLSVRHIVAGSQSIDEPLLKDLRVMCPHMKFILYYGASELNYISYCTDEEWLAHPNTVGRAFRSIEVEILHGTIYVSTSYAICGLTMPATVGDKGHWEDGYIIFEGRRGDIINRGGYKIGIANIEAKLQGLSSVDEVAIIGVTDAVRGEEIVAFMIPKQGITKRDIEIEIRKVIPIIEQPKAIYLLDELPLTDSSKIDKEVLKKWYNKK